ncbi:MAG: hypothetical protein KC416_17180, partial [Myxococcales bacterium]|nr:hypothetical protein [Myxococcales bacterium]
MKRAVSVSLGSPTRDKGVTLDLGGESVRLERRGTNGDVRAAQELFRDLDGTVDALGVGGFELSVRIDRREFPLRAGWKLLKFVQRTPATDGRNLRWHLERRTFRRLATQGHSLRFKHAFMVSGADRYALAQAIAEVSDSVTFGDFMFTFGLPIPLRSLRSLRALAFVVLPVARWLPASMLYPTGHRQEQIVPKFGSHWKRADVIAGDFHYIRRHLPDDLHGKTIVTNTTTEDDIELLRSRGARRLITTTPQLQGRSFGTNALEAALTARAGLGRNLTDDEL